MVNEIRTALWHQLRSWNYLHLGGALLFLCTPLLAETKFKVSETVDQIDLVTPELQASIRKRGYVSGVYRQTFVDRKTGFRDAGFGMDIVDWLMEPGSDASYRGKLEPELIYQHNNLYHGKQAKRSIEGPQICTKARELKPTVIRGSDFIAVSQSFKYRTAAPKKNVGSVWTQRIVFPAGKRYFVSMDRIDSVNDSQGLFLRIDMPGHIKHKQGDSFNEIYLSYHGRIPSSAFLKNFAPDAKFNYRRDRAKTVPKRFIRAYRLRDPQTGKAGPWLAGMTLDPTVVHEAWCHQRNYVCMIQEFGGRPIKAGESFQAAFIVGFFDSIDEMHAVYDAHKGHTGLHVDRNGWRLVR